MATLETKWIDVGVRNVTSTIILYGYQASQSMGDISETPDGATNVIFDPGIYGTNVAVNHLYWTTFSSLTFQLSGVRANSGWETLSIGGVEFLRSDASFAQTSTATTWSWNSVSNPFGTTAGVNKEILWGDGVAIVTPVASSLTVGTEASANVTVTVNLDPANQGSGGTLQYACGLSSGPTNWQASNSFQISRGTSGTIYGRARRSASNVSNEVTAPRPGFLAPDTAVTPESLTIGENDSSATVTVGNITANQTYAVRLNNGTSNLGTSTPTSGTTTTITFSSQLPTVGNTTTYEIFSLRPTSSGGSGSYVATDDTFTVTRAAGSGGETTIPQPGVSDYGLNVYSSTGKLIFSPSFRSTNIVNSGSVAIAGGATTSSISFEGMTTTNVTDCIVFLPGGNLISLIVTINRGTNSFTLTNNGTQQFTFSYICLRIG